MATQYDDGDFTTAQINGPDRTARPFTETGDSVTQVIYRPMVVNKIDYTPLALDTPHPTITDAYLTQETNFDDVLTGLMEFERVYSQIPATRNNVFNGTYAFTYPGIRAESTGGNVRTVTAVSQATGVTSLTAINTAAIGSAIAYDINSETGDFLFNITGIILALTGTTSSVVKIPAIPLGTDFVDGTVTELTIQPRGQKSIPTGSVVDFTYYMPGVTAGVTTFDDVKETETFTAFSATDGEAVSTLGFTTIPNSASYLARVAASEYLVVASEITRFMGNIIQRANVKVRAL